MMINRNDKNNPNPCFGCVPPKRNSECHATCKEYKIFSDNNAKKRERINNEKRKSLAFDHRKDSRGWYN